MVQRSRVPGWKPWCSSNLSHQCDTLVETDPQKNTDTQGGKKKGSALIHTPTRVHVQEWCLFSASEAELLLNHIRGNSSSSAAVFYSRTVVSKEGEMIAMQVGGLLEGHWTSIAC